MPSTTQTSIHDTLDTFMSYPLVKGSVLGANAMYWITPGINLFNYLGEGHPMPKYGDIFNLSWSKAFAGWQPLVASGIAGCATSFYVKSLLGGNQKDATASHQFWTSLVAGGVSGIALCPFENVNKNHVESSRKTVSLIYQHRGPAGFFSGTASMIARESLWTMMYMTALPRISQQMQNAGYHRRTADIFTLLFSACLFGFVSTPINRLRVMKQIGQTMPGKNQSYRQLVSTLLHEHQDKTMPKRVAGFFKGAVVRSATSVAAGGLIYWGGELYDTMTHKR